MNQGDSTSLYARINASDARAARPGAGRSAAGSRLRRLGGALEKGVEFTLETGIGRIEKLAAWDNNDVEGGSRFVAPEQLASQSLGAIADHRAANLACRSDAESGLTGFGFPDEHRHQPPTHFGA